MAIARYQSNGIDNLIDAIVAAGDKPGDARERAWQAAWTRGYQEVSSMLPSAEAEVRGWVVFAREISGGRTAILVDDLERVIAFCDVFEPVTVGARVRVTAVHNVPGSQWSLKVLAMLGCGLSVRLDEAPGNVRGIDSTWIDRLRACLQEVRNAEVAVRKRIEQERGRVKFATAPTPFRQEMEEADKALRERVLSTPYTEDEKKYIARVKRPEEMQAFASARNKRLVDLYRAEVVKFRARIPEFRADFDRRMEEFAAFRQAIDHFNEVDAKSRTITETSLRASSMLDAIAKGVLNVRAADLDEIEANPRARFGEIVATIDLLYELIPRHVQKIVAPAS